MFIKANMFVASNDYFTDVTVHLWDLPGSCLTPRAASISCRVVLWAALPPIICNTNQRGNPCKPNRKRGNPNRKSIENIYTTYGV